MRNDKYYENPKTYNEFKHNQNVAELKLKNAEKKLDEIQTVKGRLIIETKSGMEPADMGRYKRLGLKEIQTKKEIKFIFESSVDFITDKDELFSQFYYERNKVHNKLFESAEIETLCFEKQNISGYKISSVEKKIGNSNMITDFVIETSNG